MTREKDKPGRKAPIIGLLLLCSSPCGRRHDDPQHSAACVSALLLLGTRRPQAKPQVQTKARKG
jgi:hypothetical protein